MPTTYNKISVNSVTYMDLSQDTVSDAAHIRQSYSGHINDGSQVTGSYEGSNNTPVPKFTIVWDNNWENIISVTCDKTYSECVIFQSQGITGAIFVQTDQSQTVTDILGGVKTADNSGNITYTAIGGHEAYYDVTYSQNGLVTTVPSNHSQIMNITQNGIYLPIDFVKEVDVNIPIMTLPSSTSSTSSGTSKATITPSTSAQYLNVPTGYNGTAQYYTIGAMSSMTLPSSASGSSSGTSKATISPSTSAQYINIPTGYNETAQYYTVSAMPSMTLPSASSATSSGTSKATITPGSSTQYINIPTGYNSTAQYYTISAASGGGSSKNIQVANEYKSRTANSYGDTGLTLTVGKTGTYTISWVAWRGSSSGTMGTNLHINGTAEASNHQTFTGTYGQFVSLTNQSLSKDDVLTLYATSGNNSRTIYVANLTIVEET